MRLELKTKVDTINPKVVGIFDIIVPTEIGELCIHGVKLVEVGGRDIVSFPTRKVKSTGEYKDIVHPFNSEFREKLTILMRDVLKEKQDK